MIAEKIVGGERGQGEWQKEEGEPVDEEVSEYKQRLVKRTAFVRVIERGVRVCERTKS